MPFDMSELPEQGFPSGAIALCGTIHASCLLGILISDRIKLWHWGSDHDANQSVGLQIVGRPWKLFSGAIMRCSDVGASAMYRSSNSNLANDKRHLISSNTEWCLLLAGWDGSR